MATKHEKWGGALYAALRGRAPIDPLIVSDPTLTIDDAYAISQDFLTRRLADGERVVGKKIGVTSKVVQDMLGVHQPDFGFLTDWMTCQNGETVDIAARGLIAPRAEAEIAFVLGRDLLGPGVDEDAVLAATDFIAPCFEIVDSRIRDWKIGIVDTVADNASCGVYVLGDARISPRGIDLPALRVVMIRNGEFLCEGLGSAVQGSPLRSVAWLANTLGHYGVGLKAGEVILSGSLVPLTPALPGDVFEMELHGVGRAKIGFA